nr:putative Gag-polypeptide of LTR copia-type [Tanacetum cinerariifolium]
MFVIGAGRLHLAKELLYLPFDFLESFAGTKEGLDILTVDRHTEDQCFELVGYPDWWNDGHKKGNKGLRSEKGKAPIVNNESNRKNATGFGGVVAAAPDEGDEAFMVETGIWGEREGFSIPPQKPIYVSDSYSFLKQQSLEDLCHSLTD